MNIYQLIFIGLFLWSAFYTVSFGVYSFKTKNVLPAVNSLILVLISGILCTIYALM